MPQKVSSSDIARAAKVSPRSVQLHLARTRERPTGEKWQFDLMEFPDLVAEVKASRKRKRANVFNRIVSDT